MFESPYGNQINGLCLKKSAKVTFDGTKISKIKGLAAEKCPLFLVFVFIFRFMEEPTL